MKKHTAVILAVLLCGLLSACGHTHTWQSATCAAPQTCTECGKTEGVALSHTWVGASCTKSSFCSVCGATQGDALGHTVNEWKVVSDSTCADVGKETGDCAICGQVCERDISLKDHSAGEWVVSVQPTADKKGVRVKNCAICGQEMEREEFTLSEEELETLYKNSCEKISYDSLSRRPGEYEGKQVKFSGYVVQVCSEAKSEMYYSTYRVATRGRYDNVVYVKVDNYGSGYRILKDDYVTFWGEFTGLYTYETVRGDSITIPCVTVEYID